MITQIKMFTTNFKQKDIKQQLLFIASIITVLFAVCCCYHLCSQITMIQVDDIMYGNWMKHGFKYFIEQNLWHMKYFNGRTFIHLCLQIVLLFEEHLYSILMPVFLCTIFHNFFKVIFPKSTTTSRFFATGIGVMLFLSISATYLTSTLLWMSGGFNYIFPLFIISLWYPRFIDKKYCEKPSILLIILSFICGATTEQFGMITIGFITSTLFFDLLQSF